MDDPLLMAAVDSLTKFLEHLKNDLLIEKLVFPVSLDPLEQVASLTELHHDEELLCPGNVDGVVDLHHMFVVNPGLNLNLYNYTEWLFNTHLVNGLSESQPTVV